MRSMIMLGALALAGCTTSAELQASREATAARDLAEALDGRVPGRPQNCISSTGVNGPQIIDSSTLLYREGGRVWRTDLPGSCPSLNRFSIIVAELHGSQICRNDLFRAVDPGSRIPGPHCRFGQFVPYTRK
ncbi:hypothetical protein FHS95_003449 [Sphingomonas naasensis]|uniref:Uncharacterized protein n=1 Tax=Sphingomonas naasensis TaxID=1344951 RepID=A0A4V3QW19_9SPHN|nr:DUF6491 family protein [Sphingomonas naasensis]NIJ21738.1 hypothetical protein [Sphingomonas naasensis]TGX40822.1 hypothetical protein E5A74_15190 [Sphingomonas naasensis]